MSPLRERMLEDMRLAGLAEGTQQVYVTAVHQLAAHYRRSPDRLSEEEVRRRGGWPNSDRAISGKSA